MEKLAILQNLEKLNTECLTKKDVYSTNRKRLWFAGNDTAKRTEQFFLQREKKKQKKKTLEIGITFLCEKKKTKLLSKNASMLTWN